MFADPYEYREDVACAFVFSGYMEPDLVQELSAVIGRQCKPGTIVVTTEFPSVLSGRVDLLEGDESMPNRPYKIELLEKVNVVLAPGREIDDLHPQDENFTLG